MAWSEDRLHRWLAGREHPRALAGSLGHDAAVLVAQAGRDVLCCDQLIEGVHLAPGTAPARVGAKAAGRALSDLAAAAARPRALLCALRAPRGADERRLRGILRGIDGEGRRHGAPLVGGDLACASGPLSVTVTALGTVSGRVKPPGRDRARPGQVVVLTGPVGGSQLGRHLRIAPRLAEGRWLAERGASALMDVSDGLAWDLFRLARASGVRVVLEELPLHRDARRASRTSGRTARDHGLHDGEDHELIASLPRRSLPRLLAEAPRACRELSVIGRVVAGRGLLLAEEGRPWRPQQGGWRHGS